MSTGRFLMRVRVVDAGCWETSGNARYSSHRASWRLFNGPIPTGMRVCHSCDNPRCVNPNHLWLGSAKANTMDAVRKGRMAHGERHGGARLSESDVRQIYSLVTISRVSARDVAVRFGIHRNHVYKIVDGSTWGHLGLTKKGDHNG